MDEVEARRRGAELLEYASRWWAGESEVARTFFSEPRSKEEHLRWLRLQACKELQPRPHGIIIRLVDQLKGSYSDLERTVDRTDYMNTIEFLLEEFRHYVLFADVIDSLTGSRITPEELAQYEYPEEQKLRGLRQRYMEEHGALARGASGFCEGGGASIFFEGRQIGGDPVSDAVAAACDSVYRDEVDHASHGIDGLIHVAQTDAEWALAREMVEQISRQRLRMRNEQFGAPLSEARIEEIAQGNIDLPERFQALLAAP
jgi:hypothetical protein